MYGKWGYWGYDYDKRWFFGGLTLFSLIDLILRGFALWKSAKKNQNVWFIALLVVNSLGILPLIYLVLNRENISKKGKKK
jgi:hypothetical protein